MLGYELYKLISGDDSGGSSSDSGDESYSPSVPVIEATATYSIAMGGVAPGRDELVLTDSDGELLDLSGQELRFESSTDVVGFLPRPDYSDFASGSGAQIVPQKTGFAVVTYYIDDAIQYDQFLVIVPPQTLIQMMVSEASTQLTAEAEVNDDYHVTLDSDSPTANAIGGVTRNRVIMITETGNPSLFEADDATWDESPYTAVITANSSGVYQYSPVDPSNAAHTTYTNAEARSYLDDSLHRAYDQAVLSAAHIYSDNTADPTGDAFGFFSPTAEEWAKIDIAYKNGLYDLPVGAGVSDSDFPALEPIQIVVLDSVSTLSDGRPSFVFIRSKEPLDYAVVK